MQFRHVLLISSLVLLGACREERLILRFDESVADGWGIDSEYEREILRGLDEAGVDSSEASLSMQEGGLEVAVALPETALGQAREESLVNYFDSLLEERSAAEKVQLRIQAKALEDARAKISEPLSQLFSMLHEKASKMRPLYSSRIKYFDGPQLTYLKREQRGMYLHETSMISCQLTAALERPLPHIDVQLKLPGASAFLGLRSFRLPSSVSIGNSDLEDGVDNNLYNYHLNTSPMATSEHADELVIQFGELGEVDHISGVVTTSLEGLESRCLAHIVKGGRPFTFHYGRSLDRLVAVDYRFAGKAH